MCPPVDIYETPESLVVIADVPGIDPAHLEVRVDKNILTLRGQTQHQMPGDLRYREYTLVSFFRQFELGERIDQDGIRADLKHGVLTLTLPKAAKAQPRAITVNAAYTPSRGGAEPCSAPGFLRLSLPPLRLPLLSDPAPPRAARDHHKPGQQGPTEGNM